jgi:hypothetical protein
MFNFNPFKVPSYSEYKELAEKFCNDYFKFFKDWYKDVEETFNKK